MPNPQPKPDAAQQEGRAIENQGREELQRCQRSVQQLAALFDRGRSADPAAAGAPTPSGAAAASDKPPTPRRRAPPASAAAASSASALSSPPGPSGPSGTGHATGGAPTPSGAATATAQPTSPRRPTPPASAPTSADAATAAGAPLPPPASASTASGEPHASTSALSPTTAAPAGSPSSTAVLSVAERVTHAISRIQSGQATTEAVVMAALINEFQSAANLVPVSKTPDFARALLEAIRNRQSETWRTKTALLKPDSRSQLPMPDKWTIRHYTNKATVTLGETDAQGGRKVIAVGPPPFTELLSMVTLVAMREDGIEKPPLRLEANQKLYANTSSKSSGHTTALDWTNIGNIGDTFYALFYGGASATGKTPAFIKDALYFAEWGIDTFGEGWASSDWLSKAPNSKNANCDTPMGGAVEGPLSQVIATMLELTPILARRMDETTVRDRAKDYLGTRFDNFEVKKHGAFRLPPQGWQVASEENITKVEQLSWFPAKDEWKAAPSGAPSV